MVVIYKIIGQVNQHDYITRANKRKDIRTIYTYNLIKSYTMGIHNYTHHSQSADGEPYIDHLDTCRNYMDILDHMLHLYKRRIYKSICGRMNI